MLPSAGSFHTVALPVPPTIRRLLSWPVQDPATIRTLELDCTKWLIDAGTTILSVAVLVDPALTAGTVAFDAYTARVTVTGGTASTTPVIAFALMLLNGDREDVVVRVPVMALYPAIPAGAVTIGSQPITVAHMPLDVSVMVAPPGGAVQGDVVLLIRPGVPAPYLIPVAALGGTGVSIGFTFTQALPQATWTISHNLGRHPSVSVVTTSGDLVDGDVHYTDVNTVILGFAAGFAGVAYLN